MSNSIKMLLKVEDGLIIFLNCQQKSMFYVTVFFELIFQKQSENIECGFFRLAERLIAPAYEAGNGEIRSRVRIPYLPQNPLQDFPEGGFLVAFPIDEICYWYIIHTQQTS